jgi:hypothetical protein
MMIIILDLLDGFKTAPCTSDILVTNLTSNYIIYNYFKKYELLNYNTKQDILESLLYYYSIENIITIDFKYTSWVEISLLEI